MKTKIVISFLFVGSCFAVFLFSCTRDAPAVDLEAGGYPNEIGKIFLSKCAVSGCHNDISKEAAGGLSLTSWSKLFEGANGSAVVIPYRQDFSSLMYFINTYPDLGPALEPQMPIEGTALTREEVITIRD